MRQHNLVVPYCAPGARRGCYDGLKYNTCNGVHMNATKPQSDPAAARPMTEEADIGSGEKSPGHAETEEMIRQIPPLPPSSPAGEGKASKDSGAGQQP